MDILSHTQTYFTYKNYIFATKTRHVPKQRPLEAAVQKELSHALEAAVAEERR